MRPHRPAPVVPPGGHQLSAQQIQRRMERERQQQQQPQQPMLQQPPPQQPQIYGNFPSEANDAQQVAALQRDCGDDATQGEALQALQASNWDHALAIRFFKIERLVR